MLTGFVSVLHDLIHVVAKVSLDHPEFVCIVCTLLFGFGKTLLRDDVSRQ